MDDFLVGLIGFVLGGIVVRLLIGRRPRKRKSLKRFKRRLNAKQNGKCNGCLRKYAIKDFTIDHVKSLSGGGGDEVENLQLLCSNCNSLKGKRPMSYLQNKLREKGHI